MSTERTRGGGRETLTLDPDSAKGIIRLPTLVVSVTKTLRDWVRESVVEKVKEEGKKVTPLTGVGVNVKDANVVIRLEIFADTWMGSESRFWKILMMLGFIKRDRSGNKG